jgi:serine/threonine protein kinase
MAYTVIKSRGQGGFGEVFEVVNDDGEVFALKRFKPDPSIKVPAEQLLERFRREATYQRKVDNPNVVKILDSGSDEDGEFFVMELAEFSLKDYLAANSHLSHEQRVQIIGDMLDGVEAVHAASCTHRDLKPENILCFADTEQPTGYRFAISDFGLVAPPAHAETTLTMTGMAGGSTYYASPEAMKSMNRCDARSDIYSIGCIIFDLFFAKPRVPLDHLKAPGEIGRIASRCTETNPSKRYQTVSELRDEFIVAADIEEWTPQSSTEKRYLEILSQDAPTEEEWDELDIRLQEILQSGQIRDEGYAIFRAMRSDHLDQVKTMNDGVFRSISRGMIEHVLAAQAWYAFDYCDVIALKLRRVIGLGAAEEVASALLAMLMLGVSHNRFYVERIFGAECGPNLSHEIAERFLTEAEARGIDIAETLTRWKSSLGHSIPTLHPRVVEAWTT